MPGTGVPKGPQTGVGSWQPLLVAFWTLGALQTHCPPVSVLLAGRKAGPRLLINANIALWALVVRHEAISRGLSAVGKREMFD